MLLLPPADAGARFGSCSTLAGDSVVVRVDSRNTGRDCAGTPKAQLVRSMQDNVHIDLRPFAPSKLIPAGVALSTDQKVRGSHPSERACTASYAPLDQAEQGPAAQMVGVVEPAVRPA